MRQKLRAAKTGKADTTSDSSITLFGQQSSDKWKKTKKNGRKGKRNSSNVTCFGCGKEGHVITHCPEKAKEDKPEEKREENPKPGNETEESEMNTRRSRTFMPLRRIGKFTDTFYVDSGDSPAE
jgi:hypothetical protein